MHINRTELRIKFILCSFTGQKSLKTAAHATKIDLVLDLLARTHFI